MMAFAALVVGVGVCGLVTGLVLQRWVDDLFDQWDGVLSGDPYDLAGEDV